MSHLTIAASKNAFEQLFNVIRDNFSFSSSDNASFGPFSASYNLTGHLSGGVISLNDDNTLQISDMDVVFDTFTINICFNLPGFCTPSLCIVPDPWDGCLVGIPSICIGGPVCVPLDLSFLVLEVSTVKARLITKYFVDPARTAAESDLDAEFAGHPNKWQVFIDPVSVLVLVDIPNTVADLLQQAVRAAIENMFPGWVPDWAKDFIWAAIGPILDSVISILGIFEPINDWIANLITVLFPIVGLIETAIADHFANKYPINLFEDPFPIMPGESGLIPVKIPIRDLTAQVNSKEMIIMANVGT